MFGSLPGPLGHFALDDSGVDAVAAGRDLFPLQFPDQRGVPAGERLRRVMLAFRQAAFQNAEAARERQAVRVQWLRPRRFDHPRADHEVGQRQPGISRGGTGRS